ncbi:recombinase family protein [Escherichia coli]|nr:recombinase family protein [Escherichia coli]
MKKLLRTSSAGKALLVCKLNRLGRSMWHLVVLLEELCERGMNRPGFPGECFICELRLPDHRF